MAVCFFVLAGVSVGAQYAIVSGGVRNTVPFWAALVLLAVAIGISRIQPVLAMVLCTSMLIGQLVFPQGIFDQPWLYLGLAPMIVVVAASVRDRMRVVVFVFALGAGVSVAGLLSWWLSIGHTSTGERVLFFFLCAGIALGAWLFGTLVGVWSAKRDSERELEGATSKLREVDRNLFVAGEHERIAQDVHDIMAHSLSVILAQAEGARYLAAQHTEALEEPLRAIASTARSSLTDVRVLIETLLGEPETSTRRDLGDLDELVDGFSASGLTISVERFGRLDHLTAVQQLAHTASSRRA